MDFGKIGDMAGKLGVDLDKLDLQQIITDKFIKDNTTLQSVQAFLEKSGFDVSSVLDLKNISPDKLDGYIKQISSFQSWKDFLLKAAGSQLGDGVGGKLGGLGDKLGGFLNK